MKSASGGFLPSQIGGRDWQPHVDLCSWLELAKGGRQAFWEILKLAFGGSKKTKERLYHDPYHPTRIKDLRDLNQEWLCELGRGPLLQRTA